MLRNKTDRCILKKQIEADFTPRKTLSFYRYTPLKTLEDLREKLYKTWFDIEVLGRIYIASEGINAQISVPVKKLDTFHQSLNFYDFLKDIYVKFAIEDANNSFYKLTIKIKQQLVNDGKNLPYNPKYAGTYIDAKGLNNMIADENTVIVDMRNVYEAEVGHFKNALLPKKNTFRENIDTLLSDLKPYKDKKIILYCTGGIRCEKVSAYLKTNGFDKTYQLKDGIIEYTEKVKKENLPNHFIGKNFVFDERLGERISNKVIATCHQCSSLSDTHKNCAYNPCHKLFIQCPECSDEYFECCSDKCLKNLTDSQKQ